MGEPIVAPNADADTGASPTWDLLAVAGRIAVQQHGGNHIGTEHILAVAVWYFPYASTRLLGEHLYSHLFQLLSRSRLGDPPLSAPSSTLGEEMSVESDAEALLPLLKNAESDDESADALLKALRELPDAATATQLLEMASVFADRSSLQ